MERFFFLSPPVLEQAVRVRRKECAPPNYPNRAQWIGLTFCPLPLQTHPQVGAQRSTLYRWKTGGTRLHRHKDSDILTGAHTLYLNTSSCLFRLFLTFIASVCPKGFLSISARLMSNLDRRVAWIFSACFFFFFPSGFRIWKHSCFSVSDTEVMRLVSLCWQLWPRHAVPHAPLSHVPAAWWAGGGRRDGEGAHSSHPWGRLVPCRCILQSPVHSHPHPLASGGDAADAPGPPWQPRTQVTWSARITSSKRTSG